MGKEFGKEQIHGIRIPCYVGNYPAMCLKHDIVNQLYSNIKVLKSTQKKLEPFLMSWEKVISDEI